MSLYLGRPGALVALPGMRAGAKPGLARQAGVRPTIGGGRAVDYAPGVLRTYTLAWPALSRSDYETIEAFFVGAMGPGPFCLIEPGRSRNLLTVNQSSATSATNSTEGFTAAGAGESLASSAVQILRAGAPRALAWSLPAAPAGGVLKLDPPNTTWLGVPVVPGRQYRWAVQLRGGGADPVVTVAPALVWLDAAGGTVSTSTGTPVATAAATWTPASIAAAAPVGSAYARLELRVTAASVGVGGSTVYVDLPQLAMPDAADDGTVWGPGLGVPRVSLPNLDPEYLYAHVLKAGLTLTEVG